MGRILRNMKLGSWVYYTGTSVSIERVPVDQAGMDFLTEH